METVCYVNVMYVTFTGGQIGRLVDVYESIHTEHAHVRVNSKMIERVLCRAPPTFESILARKCLQTFGAHGKANQAHHVWRKVADLSLRVGQTDQA